MFKKFFAVTMASMVVFSSSLVVNAQDKVVADTNITLISDSIASTDAAVIKTVYRSYNGWLQYRRWNSTEGYWVDAEWINVCELS